MDDFRGVAVYGTEQNELLRWGIQLDGFYYSLDEGVSYSLIPDGRFKPYDVWLSVTYTLTWRSMDTGLQFQVEGTLIGEELDWSPFEMTNIVAGARAVGGIGVLVSGADPEAGMGFDNLSVEGKTVPEPGTVGLLLAGAAAVAGLRRRRAGR
jgi:hypothetical protein